VGNQNHKIFQVIIHKGKVGNLDFYDNNEEQRESRLKTIKSTVLQRLVVFDNGVQVIKSMIVE
jgi:hypothetical protein